jgi:hypothetical protein
MLSPRRGRPPKYAECDELVASLPQVMEKRSKYGPRDRRVPWIAWAYGMA